MAKDRSPQNISVVKGLCGGEWGGGAVTDGILEKSYFLAVLEPMVEEPPKPPPMSTLTLGSPPNLNLPPVGSTISSAPRSPPSVV